MPGIAALSKNVPAATDRTEQDALVIPLSDPDDPTNITTKAVQQPPKSRIEQLKDNQFLTAGVGVVGLTAALAVARKSFTVLSQVLVRHYLITLEIPVRDEAFSWFLQWMHHHQRQLSNTASRKVLQQEKPFIRSPTSWILNRIRPRQHNLSVVTSREKLPNGSYITDFSLMPGIGHQIFRYKNAFMKMSRTRELKEMSAHGTPWEVISLTTLYAHRHLFQEMLQEAQEMAMYTQEGKTVMYVSRMTEWIPFGEPRKKRPLESVVLDREVKETIMKDVQDFLRSGKWYTDRGIPYRRGYLLHGPPGTGKTSFIQALAGELEYNICIVNLSERGLTDDRLNHLLSNLPTRSLVLLEDVDAAFSNRRQADATGYAGANVTFSGLLNAVDGVASSEERLLFLTTNHVDLLDGALIRPGRVDLEMRLGMATEWQIGQMFERFYAGDERIAQLKEQFMRNLRDAGAFNGEIEGESRISTAQLQGLFVYYKRSPEAAVDNAALLVTKK